MSKKAVGLLAGIALSLVAVVVWVLLVVYAEVLAGFVGAFMGLSIIFLYIKINPADKSKFIYIVAFIVMIIEIIVAELISIALIASRYDLSLSTVMEIKEVKDAAIKDIVVGLLLSVVVFAVYVFGSMKKDNLKNRRTADSVQTANGHKQIDPNFTAAKSIADEVFEVNQPMAAEDSNYRYCSFCGKKYEKGISECPDCGAKD